jgi:hypothetical protein
MNTIRSCCLLAIGISWLFSGCSTITEKRVPLEENVIGKGSIVVSCYDDRADEKVELLTERLMMMALYSGKPDRAGSKIIQQIEAPLFSVGNLEPGIYYLRISGWKDENGKSNTSKTRDFKLKIEPGKETQVGVIISDYMKSGILIGGVVVGAVYVASMVFSVLMFLALIAAI